MVNSQDDSVWMFNIDLLLKSKNLYFILKKDLLDFKNIIFPQKQNSKSANQSERLQPNMLKQKSFEGILDLKHSLSDIVYFIQDNDFGLFEKGKKDIISKIIEVI